MRIFKKFKLQSVIVSVLYLILGICLLAVPEAAKRTVCYFAGGMLILSGLVQIVNYFLYSVVRFGFLWGIIDVFAGIFIVSSADIFAQSEIFALLFGILLAGKSIFEFQTAADMKRFGVKLWWVDMAYAALLLALGVVLLFDPFGAERALFVYLGVCALLNGILGIVVNFFVSGRIKKVKHTVVHELGDDQFEIKDAPEEADDDTDVR
ncbi:MAG: HdeD family acid-resistance protein [Christensenellales bacterium]